jgi:RimJ/RimL family protein N-acetyltransferase
VSAAEIITPRLRLIPATESLLDLELGDIAAFGLALNARVPEDWPPGEYDRNAIQFFLERLRKGGAEADGWYGWYVVKTGNGHSDLVGAGGYMGPPDKTGTVEAGYSVSKLWQGQGIATEMLTALASSAFHRGAAKIIAHTTEQNAASIALLKKSGFRNTISNDPAMLQFECSLGNRPITDCAEAKPHGSGIV